MDYISTRNSGKSYKFNEIVLQGLAPDGGLYVPSFLPLFDEKKLQSLRKLDYNELFFEVTQYFVNDSINLVDYKKIVDDSYSNFKHGAVAPLKQISHNQFLLELFHGPTLAFKDFALQFLGNLLDYFLQKDKKEIVIVGATSGDTGSAAIHGCKKSKYAKIFILHPLDKVSEIQRKQMTTIIEDNVFNIAIEGNFDDCQTIVKKLFAIEAQSINSNESTNFLKSKKLVAVNSINFARILAQIVYYFYAATRVGIGSEISFSVPTGNFGDIYAGFLAKKMGLNINKLIIATNSNDILHRFLLDNDYKKSEMVQTISPSMNIQVSSNFERMLFDLYKVNKSQNELAKLMENFEQNGYLKVEQEILSQARKIFYSSAANDYETKEIIKKLFEECSEIIDPHTAIGIKASLDFEKTADYKKEIIVNLATAHPAKFPEAIIETINVEPKLPNFLGNLKNKEEKFEILPNDLNEVKNYISKNI